MNDDTIEYTFTLVESLDPVDKSEEKDLMEWRLKEIKTNDGQLQSFTLQPDCNAIGRFQENLQMSYQKMIQCLVFKF